MSGRIAIDEEADERWDASRSRSRTAAAWRCATSAAWGACGSSRTSSRLGPDAAVATRAEFRKRIGRGGGPIKARMMDQGVVAGVGNLLADEILWRARIDPARGEPAFRGRGRRAAGAHARRVAARGA